MGKECYFPQEDVIEFRILSDILIHEGHSLRWNIETKFFPSVGCDFRS
jgi:hypothetical protein